MMDSDIIDDFRQREILSVTDLNRRTRQLLETHFPLLWVEGEISNFVKPSSGHWYFTLKDAKAQVRCAMFKNRNNRVTVTPEQGQQVLVRARISLYEGRGDYQLIVEHLEPAGFGVLQRAFEALKTKLGNEGLFDPAHKRPLPALPKHLGVITSPTGAAIRDVLSVLKRRFPAIPITILPVQVQGEGAAQQIVEAIALANRLNLFDVLLITRGGGSLEDLWPFNEEIVARAIYASELPVVSAVGHEVDVTISDFVADVRAPTPSAAAELLSPDRDEWYQVFTHYQRRFSRELRTLINHQDQRLAGLRARLRHPGQHIQHQAQQLDSLELRLRKAMTFQLHQNRSRLHTLAWRQQSLHPQQKLRQLHTQVSQLGQRARLQMQQSLRAERRHFSRLVELLETVSPLNTLQRGYSIVLDDQGSIVRHSQQLHPGDAITAKLGQGEVRCTVAQVNPAYESLTAPYKPLPNKP